jgi:hypothetical protein
MEVMGEWEVPVPEWGSSSDEEDEGPLVMCDGEVGVAEEAAPSAVMTVRGQWVAPPPRLLPFFVWSRAYRSYPQSIGAVNDSRSVRVEK